MKKYLCSFLVIVQFFASCTVYKIPTESFFDQIKKTAPQNVGYYVSGDVKGNDLKSLQITDSLGQIKYLDVNNKTEVRIEQFNKLKVTYYLNTVTIRDSLLFGSKTHYFTTGSKGILIKNISKIEILP